MLQLHLFQIDLEFFGKQHRYRGVRALAHFDIRHRQDDPAIGFDADKGVRYEPADSRFRAAACKRHA
jgi:hypothetical protein